MTTTYMKATKEKKYTMAQKKASVLFQREGIHYIPVENVTSVTYGNGKYFITLRSNGILILKLNS